jgi:hypothetical protein
MLGVTWIAIEFFAKMSDCPQRSLKDMSLESLRAFDD